MRIDVSGRLKRLPPYLFVEIDRAKREALKKGRPIIDLGVGDPDLPTPDFIVAELARAAAEPANQHYALDAGLLEMRVAISNWYQRRFGVRLDPQTEILPLIGSKEGIAHLPLAVINPGDTVLVPDPSYPPYKSGVILAGGKIELMPLLEENGFLPDLKRIKDEAKLLFLNYPNNPTGAVADIKFFRAAVEFAQRNKILICHDAAYSELTYDGYKAPSFLEAEGAKKVGIEFHSLSKTCLMTGWRIGWAAGNKGLIAALLKVKSNIDSGIFSAIQVAGVKALERSEEVVAENIKVFQSRRDTLVNGLKTSGWELEPPKATFYVWAEVPRKKLTSSEFAKRLLKNCDIVVTPGIGFGKYGEGYIRMAITVPKERLADAVERIRRRL